MRGKFKDLPREDACIPEMLPGSVHRFARHLRHSGLIFDAEEKLESEEFVTGADHGGHVDCRMRT